LSVDLIKNYNRMVLKNLPLDDPRIVPGEIFPYQVMVAKYKGAPRKECDFLLGRLCEWINHLSPNSAGMEMEYSFIKAVLSHLYVAWIHPFGDGNGRVARLMELQILCGAGVPSLSAHLFSNHYNHTRDEYYRELANASISGGDVIPFMEYAFQGFLDMINDQLATIQFHQLKVVWKDHVYRAFQDESGKVTKRQRQVALDLWDHDWIENAGSDGRYLPFADVSMLSPAVAGLYAGVSMKTISRDLNSLASKGLILKKGRSIRGNYNVLGKMRPRQRTD
jgi:Fic family protein